MYEIPARKKLHALLSDDRFTDGPELGCRHSSIAASGRFGEGCSKNTALVILNTASYTPSAVTYTCSELRLFNRNSLHRVIFFPWKGRTIG